MKMLLIDREPCSMQEIMLLLKQQNAKYRLGMTALKWYYMHQIKAV